MKVTRKQDFNPITITIETQDEFNVLYDMVNSEDLLLNTLSEIIDMDKHKYKTVLNDLWNNLVKYKYEDNV